MRHNECSNLSYEIYFLRILEPRSSRHWWETGCWSGGSGAPADDPPPSVLSLCLGEKYQRKITLKVLRTTQYCYSYSYHTRHLYTLNFELNNNILFSWTSSRETDNRKDDLLFALQHFLDWTFFWKENLSVWTKGSLDKEKLKCHTLVSKFPENCQGIVLICQ